MLHYVMAGVSLLFSLLPLLYALIGFAIVAQGGPGQEVGWFFLVIFGSIALVLIVAAILSGIGGIFLHRRKARAFCFMVAIVLCIVVPLGTVLGIFTILVLN